MICRIICKLIQITFWAWPVSVLSAEVNEPPWGVYDT